MYEKPSVFLKNKCETLKNAIKFFETGSQVSGVIEKRLIFLSQIDFWDWEVETVIFSFDNFKERQKSWNENGKSMENILLRKDMVIKPKLLQDLKYDRYYRSGSNVFAPIKDLNEMLETWNKLLNSCEPCLIDSGKFGSAYLKDLSKYRKKLKC